MRPARLPFELKIESPCTQSWDDMTGSATQRHCASCQKQVHNLAALTPRQIEHLFAFSCHEVCGRVTRQPDSSIVTTDSVLEFPRFATLTLSASILLAPAAAFSQDPAPTAQTAVQAKLPTANKAVTGVVTDSQGALVVGSHVTLLFNGTAIGSTETDEAGQFAFAVIPGTYQLQVEAQSFAKSSRALVVKDNEATVTAVALTPGLHISEEVTVTSVPTTTLMGAMTSTLSYGHWYQRWLYRLRHPIAYTKYLFRQR